MAEQIVAELSGKLEKFATGYGQKPGTPAPSRRATYEEDAIAALTALGERRSDAEHFLDRVKQGNAGLKTTDALLREMLRLRTVRG
jgi:Holliday junction resolvasome RuvABC DNA-binding subunit